MMESNHMKLEFDSLTDNTGFARVAVAAFLTQLNPTLEEVSDVKTAVSEAVTNAIIHGYEENEGTVFLTAEIKKDEITIQIADSGKGIDDVKQAMEPLYTSKPEKEHSGMGFMFMQAFMDEVNVESKIGQGTCISMRKKIGDR